MPVYECWYSWKKKTWSTMPRWERKQWYRDNETRIARGLKPKSKP